jgi:hypothetical protein
MKRRIAAAPNDEVHPLVLAILEAVWRATGRRRLPYYVSLDSVRRRPDIEGNETAIMLAAAVITEYSIHAGVRGRIG